MDRSSHHQAGLGDDSSDEKERDSRGDHITDSDETRSRACITVEEDFEFGKSHFGLADSQVRHYTPICRHLALSMAALAVCAVTAALARPRPSTCAGPGGDGGTRPEPAGSTSEPACAGERPIHDQITKYGCPTRSK